MLIRHRNQVGQVGLIVLLIMVVLVTVAVSVASRSVSELRLERQETESTRSLNLAESGIEDLLAQDLASLYMMAPSDVITVAGQNINYAITVGAITDYCVAEGHTLDVDLTGATTLEVNWERPDNSTNNTYGVVAIVNSSGSIVRRAYKFSGSSNSGGIDTDLPASIGLSAGDKLARLKALYERLCFSVTGTNLPDQVYTVKTSATLADGTTRAVEVTKANASLPSIFDYVLFSGSELVKN